MDKALRKITRMSAALDHTYRFEGDWLKKLNRVQESVIRLNKALAYLLEPTLLEVKAALLDALRKPSLSKARRVERLKANLEKLREMGIINRQLEDRLIKIGLIIIAVPEPMTGLPGAALITAGVSMKAIKKARGKS